jgi:hypothetical protein
MKLSVALLGACLIPGLGAAGQEPLVHGLWVWKTPIVLQALLQRTAVECTCRHSKPGTGHFAGDR